MTLAELLEHVRERLDGLKIPINYAENGLKHSPDGLLYTRGDGVSTRYYRRTNEHKTLKYLRPDEEEEIRKLENKGYCLQLARVALAEKRGLEKVCAILGELQGWETVYLSVPQKKRHLIEPCVAPVVAQIGALPACSVRHNDAGRHFITGNGEAVRSKSELIIADRLKAAGVSYKYESPLVVRDTAQRRQVTLHPDFMVLNARTGKLFYWEHLGMLDNPEYCDDCQRRIEVYADNGIFPGRNLIISSESSIHPLDTGHIDKLIAAYLK